MTPVGGALSPANEIDDARWVALAEAAARLTHGRDRELLHELPFVPAPAAR
jgi:hypothetical protein